MQLRPKLILFGFVTVVGVAAALVAGCRSTGECNNAVCACPSGDSCDFVCGTPPCHARCNGNNDSCNAQCANGTCTCGQGSHCSFTCKESPCHVSCSANSTCSGTCSDGQCDCGAGSTCNFTCMTSPCHSTCAAGARCVVLCPPGRAGTQDCDLVACAAGVPLICPGGNATTCGAACP